MLFNCGNYRFSKAVTKATIVERIKTFVFLCIYSIFCSYQIESPDKIELSVDKINIDPHFARDGIAEQ